MRARNVHNLVGTVLACASIMARAPSGLTEKLGLATLWRVFSSKLLSTAPTDGGELVPNSFRKSRQ